MVRFKNRYIVVEINPEAPLAKYAEYKLTEHMIYPVITSKVQQLYGDFGAAAITNGFIVKYWNAQLRTVLIRVRHGPHKFITSSLPLVERISDKAISLHTLYVGGSMRSCFKFLIKYHKRRAFKDLTELKGTPEYDRLFKAFTQVKHLDNISHL